MSLLELFCKIDDFCQEFEQGWHQQLLEDGQKKRKRNGRMSLSEMMTLVVYFHQMGFRNFKSYYMLYVGRHLRGEFPKLLSYTRFVQLMPHLVTPMSVYLQSGYGSCTGISFIDATALVVCHNRRISQHRVFKDIARRGKTSTGWFFGFKLHVVVNELGELLGCCVTPANVDDRQPAPRLTAKLVGKLFADMGYLSQPLFTQLWQRGLHLITKVRKNMKNKLMVMTDKLLLRKRAIIETINDQLKNISQIEHPRHRSLTGFMLNLLAGLVAYSHQSRKPSIYHNDAPILQAFIQN
jgi:transposase